MTGENTNSIILNRTVNTAIALISLLLLIYTGYRAENLSFVFDESLSYNVYAQQDFMGIVSYKIASANSHMLNTLSLKYISLLFGTSGFLLRLPSLLFQIVYIIFSYKILKRLSDPLILLAGFLLLNLNPFVLEYFSLARGYAMAVSFMLVSIYFLFKYLETHNEKNIIWSFLFGMFAVLGNYCLLVYYVSLILIVNIILICSQDQFKFKELLRKNIPVISLSVVLIIIMFEPIRKLVKYKELYDGGMIGFWVDTVGSLIDGTLYGQSYREVAFNGLRYFVAISSVLLIILSAYQFYLHKKKVFTEKFTVAVLLLFVPVIVSVTQHLLINSLFLINRMALFFIPLFILSITLFYSELAKSGRLKILSYSAVLILAAIFSLHALYSVNGTHTYIWKYDADTKHMLTDLETDVKNNNLKHVKLGVMWLFEPTSNFYRRTKNYNWLEKVSENDYRTTDYDYYYLADSCMAFINARNLKIIRQYPVSNSYLVKKER